MSWSIEEHIGEGRPWPEQVVVYRGETDESLTYARRSLSDVNKMVELMDTLAAENAKLREQMERLVTLLRADCDIEASWDGLRKFWSIGLTENGCLMRDRACKAEAENAELRELMRHLRTCMEHYEVDGTISCDRCPLDNCVGNCDYERRMRELGVEE